MMIRQGLVAVAAMGLVVTPAVGQDYTHPKEMDLPVPAFARPDPDKLRMELDNHLVAYVAEDHRAPLVTLTAFVGAGSGHGEPGAADQVAAALRQGPASTSGPGFRAALDAMAATYTVTVGREETEITLDVPAEDAWAALELLAATLEEPGFEASTAAVSGRAPLAGGIDWASSIAGAIGIFEGRLYKDHPFGRVPSPSDLDGARSGGAERLYRRYFVPGNTALAIAGDFDAAEARGRTARAFSAWDGDDPPGRRAFPALTTSAPRQVLTADAPKLQGWVVIGHELPQVPSEDRAALAVMDYILGAYHLDSRLFRNARELRGLTNDNSSFLQPAVLGPGSYTFRTYGRPEAIRLLIDVTFAELERIRDGLATEDEMFVAKGALVEGLYASNYATGVDATRNYALEWLREGDHNGSATYPGRIQAVTRNQVREAARKYIHPERMIIAVVGPLDKIGAAPMIESEPDLEAWGAVERMDRGSR